MQYFLFRWRGSMFYSFYGFYDESETAVCSPVTWMHKMANLIDR